MSVVVAILLMMMMVQPHPICNTNFNPDPTCSTNLTANESFLNEWLSLHDESKGIDQLRGRRNKSIASILLNFTTTKVAIFKCIKFFSYKLFDIFKSWMTV